MRIEKIPAIAALLAALLVAADFLFPPPLGRANEASELVLDREGRWVHAFATPEGRWRFAAKLDDVDPTFVERVIEIEDKRFLDHRGVDIAAVARRVERGERRPHRFRRIDHHHAGRPIA